jgi:hypothetical protein
LSEIIRGCVGLLDSTRSRAAVPDDQRANGGQDPIDRLVLALERLA